MSRILVNVLVVLACTGIITSCVGYKFLVVFPLPGRSHGILGDGVTRLLLDAGHEVTFITVFPKKDSNPKLHQVDISSALDAFPTNIMNMTTYMEQRSDSAHILNFVAILGNLSEVVLNHSNVKKLMDDDQHFDLIIVEWILTEVFAGFSAVFECPFIWLSSSEPNSAVLELIDEALNPAYNPGPVSRNITPLNFIQRAQELMDQILFKLMKQYHMYKSRGTYEKVFGPIMAKKGKPLPDYEDLVYNASLMLGNSHVSLGRSMRFPQNYIPVGGYHVESDVKPLPENLQKIMDGAKNGVIYFSMGSNLKSTSLPEQVKRDILKMFGGLKYTVIWKFEEHFKDLPKNLHMLQWAPQQSILSHPNCILFITHGGMLSTIETVHFGVPIIGIPVYADQPTNVDRAVENGYAKRVDLSYDIAEDLKEAIEDILGDPKYTEMVKVRSQVYHDRPVPPARELVHWVEHVVRTRGAPHLRSAALLVPWYQKMYLDLLAAIFATCYVLKIVAKRFLSNKKQAKSRKTDRKKIN